MKVKYCPSTQKRNNDENQANHDRAKLNGSTGDHSALDNAINQANSTPGLTVIRDADYQTTKNSDDYTGIGAWQDDAKGLYSRETDAINAAIAKQKQNWQDFRKTHQIGSDTLSSDQVQQQLELGRENEANVAIANVSGQMTSHASNHYFDDRLPGEWYAFRGSVNGTVLIATFTNLHNSYYTDENGVRHRIAKIVRTFSDLTNNGLGLYGHLNPEQDALIVMHDPTQGFWYLGASGVTYDDVYYDENGNPINIKQGTGWLAATSLNALYSNGQFSKTGEPFHVEKAIPLSNGEKAYSLISSSIRVHSDGSLYADQTNDSVSQLVGAWGIKNPQSITTAPFEWDSPSSPNRYYGAGLISLNGVHHKIRAESTGRPDRLIDGHAWPDTEEIWYAASTVIPPTPTPRTEIHYHYNKLNVNSVPDKSTTVHYHYDVFRFSVKARTLPYISL